MASIADQFLQYGQLRAQQSQNLGNSIGDTIDLAMKMRAQREADLEAARQKEAERMAAQQAKQQENMLDPEKAIMALQTKAAMGAPLSPQEEAVLQTAKGVLGSKVVYDQYGQPRAGYDLSRLGMPAAAGPATGIAATPLMPAQEEALPLPTLGGQGVLMPPPADGANPSRADFEQFMAGGQLPPPQADVLAPSRSTQIAQTAEQRLAEMGISKPVKPERLDFTTAKQYEADLASYNDALNKQRQAIFEEKKVSTADKKAAPAVLKDLENSIKTIDRAIEQSNKLNTGFVGGRTVLGANVNPFANDLQGTLGTIQARTALDSLVQAKERGATFGALSDAELQLLKDRTASLDRSQSQEQLDANLKEIREMYSGIAGKIKQAAGMQDKPTAANVDGKLKAAGYSEAQIRAYKQAKGIK